MEKVILCNTEIFVPVAVPGLATGSSSSSASSSSTSLPQDTSGDIPSSPSTQRSDDTNVPASRNRSRTPTKTKNRNKNCDNEPASRNRLRDLPGWLEEVTENFEDKRSTNIKGHTPANTSQDSDSERPTKVVSRKHSIYTHFPKDRNCEICKRPKITRSPCWKRTGDAVLRAETSVTWCEQITKSSMKEVNFETITDTQSCCKIQPLNGYNLTRAKQKLLRKRSGVYESFPSRRRSQKLFTQTILWNLANPVKIYRGIIVHQDLPIRDQWLLRKRSFGIILFRCCLPNFLGWGHWFDTAWSQLSSWIRSGVLCRCCSTCPSCHWPSRSFLCATAVWRQPFPVSTAAGILRSLLWWPCLLAVSSGAAASAAAAAAMLCLASSCLSVPTRGVDHRRSATMSNASLFCGTLEPTRMRWECGQVRVTRLRKGSNCAGVQWCQVCAPINTLPQLELSLRSSWLRRYRCWGSINPAAKSNPHMIQPRTAVYWHALTDDGGRRHVFFGPTVITSKCSPEFGDQSRLRSVFF